MQFVKTNASQCVGKVAWHTMPSWPNDQASAFKSKTASSSPAEGSFEGISL